MIKFVLFHESVNYYLLDDVLFLTKIAFFSNYLSGSKESCRNMFPI